MSRPQVAEDTVLSWVVAAAQAADDKQAHDVLVLDVGEVLSITGWFVICDAGNPRQVKAIAEAVQEGVVAAGGQKAFRVEGLDSLHWVLMDFGDFVVHVFLDEIRSYYELERLWSDVPRVDWQAEATPLDAAVVPTSHG
jgi:ribosome-associated protein